MAIMHVSEMNAAAGTEGGLRYASDRALLVNGDLTSLATAIANAKVKTDKLHVSERTIGPRIAASLNLADHFVAGFSSGSNLANFENIVPNQQVRGRFLRF